MSERNRGRYVITLHGAKPFNVYVSDTDDVQVGQHQVVVQQKGGRTYYPWHRVDSVTFWEPHL